MAYHYFDKVEFSRSQKPVDVGVAYVLLLLLGLVGGHKFYLGRPFVGLVYILTGGLLGVGVVWDLFTMRRQVDAENWRRFSQNR